MRAVALLVLLVACRDTTTKRVMCPDGYTECDGECFNLLNDVRHCGACDHACQSNEECAAGVCQPICPAGQHVCNGVCVSNSAVETCGTRCTPCPTPVNGIATCDGMSCGGICDPNRRFCLNTCADCPSGTGVKCVGSLCLSSGCPLGQHLCNGQCVDENPGSCGDSCLSCPAAPASGYQVCLNGGCEFLCRPGFRTCPAGCCTADFIEVGSFHSCRLTPAGSMLCWGRNHVEDMMHGGQLGDGTYLDRSQAVPVLTLTSGIVAVQGGEFHTCAMDQFGAVSCWGYALNGRLGDGTSSDKLAPTPVMGLGAGVAIAVSAGGTGGCVLTRGGQVRCWGENLHGEVGDGSMMPRSTPVLVSDLGTSVVDVSAGGGHACALIRGGTVRCWGDNAQGQLGDSSQMPKPRPVLVTGLFDAVRISAGDRHTCAIRKGGELVCWGDNSDSQGGRPDTELFHSTPTVVDGAQGASEVSAGGEHTCALFSGTGQVLCWGANGSGQLGDGTMNGRSAPAPVSLLTEGTAISAGRSHTCARTRSGTRCWGNNEYGQLGDGTSMNRSTPVMTQ